MDGWVLGGVTYASYNIVAAIVILPVLRHLRERSRCGHCRAHRRAPGHDSGGDVLRLHDGLLPADRRRDAAIRLPAAALELPWFRFLFQLMIFAALLESGTGAVHAINERIDNAWRRRNARAARARRAR